MKRSGLDLLVIGNILGRSHDLDPARVKTRLDQVQLVIGVFAVLRDPHVTGRGIDVHAEAVADAVCEGHLDVLSDLSTDF